MSVTWKYQWEAPVFADRQSTLCAKQKTSDILKFISARFSMPMLMTQQTILFY